MKKNSISDVIRCPWVDLSKPDYVKYHDKEWGVPVFDDKVFFEFLTLEAAQAGLSWYTVLRKRHNYRRAYENFDPEKVAKFDKSKINSLLQNPGIIRNRLKIEASVNNAIKFLKVQEKYGSFSGYIWAFVDNKSKINQIKKIGDYPTTSKESDALSRDLKKRGFKFTGTTICYAFMQAVGMVNDHVIGCFRYNDLKK